MKKDWKDFKTIYNGIEGAREGFEDACTTLFKKIYEGQFTERVRVNKGDGGIDIFSGSITTEPIIVIQCKCFIDSFEDSQKNQIRESFKTAKESKEYKLKEWILCIPYDLDLKQQQWWDEWSTKNSADTCKISLKTGSTLIDLLKEHNLYNSIFKIEDSIKLDEIHRKLCPQKIVNIDSNIHHILFNTYIKDVEQYYIKRTIDLNLVQTINNKWSAWIYGYSGCGKTALINRNLIQQEITYYFCDLSPVTIGCGEDILNEVLTIVEEKSSLTIDKNESNIIKKIVKLLLKINTRVIIVIDELSIHNEELYNEIFEKILQLVTHYNNNANPECELNFIISTIFNPNRFINKSSKASQYFNFIQCENWDEYLPILFDTIQNALSLNDEILIQNKNKILSKCKNSPRSLKLFFNKYSITKNIEETLSFVTQQLIQ